MHGKTLVENMMPLLVVQGATHVLPLLTSPYRVRVLGTGNYRRIAFAHVFDTRLNRDAWGRGARRLVTDRPLAGAIR